MASEIVVKGRARLVFHAAKFKKIKNTGDLTQSKNNCALVDVCTVTYLIEVPNRILNFLTNVFIRVLFQFELKGDVNSQKIVSGCHLSHY